MLLILMENNDTGRAGMPGTKKGGPCRYNIVVLLKYTSIMEKFMMIIREDLEKMRKLTNEERFSNIPMMLEWVDSLIASGNYIMGEPLLTSGRYVSKEQILSDGPFIESREGVSGYEIIWAENLDQAAAIAQTCPLVRRGLAVREVRPIYAAFGVYNDQH
jgi:hypothetical protein